MLRKLTAACAVLAFVAVAGMPGASFAEEKKFSPAQLKQQQKMKDCAADWNSHKQRTGAEGKEAHQAFMSDCLSGRPISAAAKAKPKTKETADEKAARKKQEAEEKAAKKKAADEEKAAKKKAADAEKKAKKEKEDAEKKEKAKKKKEDDDAKKKKKAA